MTEGARGDRPTRALAPAELLRGLATGTDEERANGDRDPSAADAGWRRGAAIAVLAVAGAGALATSGRVATGSGAIFGESAAISRVAGRADGSVEAQGDSDVKTRKFGTDALRGAVVAAALTAGATAQDAVQWRVEDGGNGHWYVRSTDSTTWHSAKATAQSVGGHLATVLDAGENEFIRSISTTAQWIGGLRAPGTCGSNCNWRWDSGDLWSFTNWRIGEPNGGELEQSLTFYADGTWDDNNGLSLPYVIEWSADCNSDGIVDYGQIRAGQLPDANANNVPDSCECSSFPELAACRCVGDIVADRIVNGADLGTLLSYWGPRTSGSFSIASDLNDNGTIDGADLGMLLSNWGECQPAAVIVPPWATLIEAAPDPAVVTDPALRTAIAATGLAWRVRDTGTGIEMLLVPPGTFQMGCVVPSNGCPCQSREQPVNTVVLSRAFYLGRFEVTQGQWLSAIGSNPSHFQMQPDSPSRPVESVSWDAIQIFNDSTGLRLPTEAEWEYSCRAGTVTPFYNRSTDDSTLGTLAWYAPNSGNQTHPVGAKIANALGFSDMLGNVSEWVSDWYGTYPPGTRTDPTGPATGTQRVIRGGAWYPGAAYVRCSDRDDVPPANTDIVIGFRVARNP